MIAGYNTDNDRIHTFGIGSGCDKDLVVQVAKAGRGSSCIVGQDSTKMLNTNVVTALSRAFEPSLKNCMIIWDGKEESMNEVFRNQMVHRTAIMTQKSFEKLQFAFYT